MEKQNILIISFGYPPLSAIGSRRIAMQAKGLFDAGYTPYVITAKNPPQKHELENLIPDQYVYHLSWIDIWQLKYYLDKFMLTKIFGKVIGYFFPFTSNTIPERRRFFWIHPAVKKSLEIIKNHDIKLIYSSYTPPASIRVASILKEKTGIPWINEYRDLWAGNPYTTLSEKRERINLKKEKELISKADALVTVSEPLKKDLQNLHNKPTYVIYNGIDKILNNKYHSVTLNRINIVYAGSIYKGKRDPMPLFLALKLLKEKDENLYNRFSVNFYGKAIPKLFKSTIKDFELTDVVKLHEPVSHEEIIEIQSDADVLLLLGWNNKADEGVLTGKIFEYLGFGKPILGLGYQNGAIDNVLQETNTGKIINDPDEISDYLIEITKTVKSKEELKLLRKKIKTEPYLRDNQINNLIRIFDVFIKK